MTARNWIIAGICLVLCGTLLTLYLREQHAQKERQLEPELKSLPSTEPQSTVPQQLAQANALTQTTPFTPRPRNSITYSRDIAPIFFRHCAACHRPGESGPFSLLEYADCRSHASQIADIVRCGIMPPWLPDSTLVTYADQRVLSSTEIGLICQWVDEGAVEGDRSDLPAQPPWTNGWQLGQPDMVVEFPQPFTLPAEGGDVFRNFVIPVALTEKKYVRAVEIRPANPRVVHHGVLLIDSTGQSRKLDEEDAEPGFGGMIYGPAAHSPDGFFIGWTPGKIPFQAQKDMAWDLNPGTDIVLQLHLVPIGKPVTVKASIGLFFSVKPPTKIPMVLRVGPRNIDISAGDSDYRIKDQFELPVDVDVLSVYPHAHYLGHKMLGEMVNPNGVRKPLIRIAGWDFKWQDEYRFPTPIPVEKGAILSMEYSYDNSQENVRNPSRPPRRVTYGPQSSDEMGDLWVQVLPHSQPDREILRAARAKKEFETDLIGSIFEVKIRPKDIQARYNLACMLESLGELDAAATQYSLALRISPEHAPSMNNLGVVRCKQGRYDDAIPLLKQALRLNPNLEDARHNLNLAREAIKQTPKP